MATTQWSEFWQPWVAFGLVAGDRLVFKPEVAVDVVAGARGVRTPVVGVDAFRFTSQGIEYLFDHSASFTSDDGIIADSWSKATVHLRRYAGSEILFAVMIDD